MKNFTHALLLALGMIWTLTPSPAHALLEATKGGPNQTTDAADGIVLHGEDALAMIELLKLPFDKDASSDYKSATHRLSNGTVESRANIVSCSVIKKGSLRAKLLSAECYIGPEQN